MTILAGIDVAAADFLLGRILAETTTRIDLTRFVPVGEQFVPYFWKEHDGDTEAFERSVREHPAVDGLTDLDGRVDSSLYHIDWGDAIDGLLNALYEHDVLVEEATTTDGERWLFRLRAPDQDALSGFQRTCHDSGVPLNVQRVQHNPAGERQSRALVGVTPKQREAVVLARERGYFQVPREHSATELGEELGISRQAFSRRLQRAQQRIFTNLSHDLDRQ